MKPGLGPGSFAEVMLTVTPEMCPHFDGILVHPVLATWTLVHHIEIAGRKLLLPFLEPHEEGVGAHLSVDHRSPAPIGSLVRVRADFESFQHSRLTARTTAWSGDRELARGTFVQVILPRERLIATFDRHRPDSAK